MLIDLPYLDKKEDCICHYNDAHSPDFWDYKNHHIYITNEGKFDIHELDENTKEPLAGSRKICSSLQDAIFYIKYSKKLNKTFKEMTIFDLSQYKNFYITLLSETEWNEANEKKWLSKQLIQKREILLREENTYNIHTILSYENAHLILKVPDSMLKEN